MQASRVKIIYYSYETAARVQLHSYYIYSRMRSIYDDGDDELRYIDILLIGDERLFVDAAWWNRINRNIININKY